SGDQRRGDVPVGPAEVCLELLPRGGPLGQRGQLGAGVVVDRAEHGLDPRLVVAVPVDAVRELQARALSAAPSEVGPAGLALAFAEAPLVFDLARDAAGLRVVEAPLRLHRAPLGAGLDATEAAEQAPSVGAQPADRGVDRATDAP